MYQVNEAFVNDDNNSDSGVSGGNGGGSQEDDAGSLGHDEVPLVAESAAHLQNSLNLAAAHGQDEATPQGVSGHENPVYDNTGDMDGTYDGSDFSSFTSGRLSMGDEERGRQFPPRSVNGRQSPPRSVDGRDSSPSFEEVRAESAPYEPMVVLPSGAMQLQNARQINGQQKTNAEAHFRLNPLYNESQQM